MSLEYFLRWLCPNRLYCYSTKVRLPQSTVDFRKFLIAKWLLQKGGSAIDGGAHIGYYSRYFSEILGNRGTVYSFEPNPYMYRLLNKYARGCENIKAFPNALSNQTNVCSFYVQPFSLSQDSNLTEGRPGQKKIKTKTVRLDDLIDKTAQINLIKLDVEGHELQALLGAEQLICRCHPWIIFEYVQNELRNDQEIVSLLQSWGYRCMDLEDLQWLPNSKQIDLTDVIAVPQIMGSYSIDFLESLKHFSSATAKG